MTDRDLLAQNIEALKHLPAEARFATLTEIAIATGGYAHTPDNGNTWDSQDYQLSAQGVFAMGSTPAECVRMWLTCATRELRRLDALASAEATLRSQGPIPAWELRMACQTIAHDSQDVCLRKLAEAELQKLDAVAA